MMPHLDGLETCRRLKQMTDVPVLMLSALATEKDVVCGFEAGADDYLRKPFSLAELCARVKALLRSREFALPSGQSTLRIGALEMDLARRTVTLDGAAVKLTSTEYRLLAYLVQNAGIALTAQDILEHVWGEEYHQQGAPSKVYICYLRRNRGTTPTGLPTYRPSAGWATRSGRPEAHLRPKRTDQPGPWPWLVCFSASPAELLAAPRAEPRRARWSRSGRAKSPPRRSLPRRPPRPRRHGYGAR